MTFSCSGGVRVFLPIRSRTYADSSRAPWKVLGHGNRLLSRRHAAHSVARKDLREPHHIVRRDRARRGISSQPTTTVASVSAPRINASLSGAWLVGDGAKKSTHAPKM